MINNKITKYFHVRATVTQVLLLDYQFKNISWSFIEQRESEDERNQLKRYIKDQRRHNENLNQEENGKGIIDEEKEEEGDDEYTYWLLYQAPIYVDQHG